MGRRPESRAAIELERRVWPHIRPFAANSAIGLRVSDVFQRIDSRHAEVPFLAFRKTEFGAQLLSDQGQQGIVFGARQVAYAHLGNVGSAASRADDDKCKLSPPAPGDQLDLAAKAVAGVEHQVIAAIEQLGQIARRQELGNDIDFYPWVDSSAAFGKHVGLAATKLTVERVQLPVAIGKADLIGVDQGQLADAATGEGFHRPGADPAQADNADVLFGKTFYATLAVEPIDARKAFVQNFVHGQLYFDALLAKFEGLGSFVARRVCAGEKHRSRMKFRLIFVLALALALAACTSVPETKPAPVVTAKPAPALSRPLSHCPDCGRIQKIEVVRGVRATAQGGVVLGGVVGGVMSSPNKAAKPANGAGAPQTSYRLTVRMDDGRRLLVHQNQISPSMRVGSIIRYVKGRVYLLR